MQRSERDQTPRAAERRDGFAAGNTRLRGRPVTDDAIIRREPDPVIDHCVGIRGGLAGMRDCHNQATHAVVVLRNNELQKVSLCDDCGQRGDGNGA